MTSFWNRVRIAPESWTVSLAGSASPVEDHPAALADGVDRLLDDLLVDDVDGDDGLVGADPAGELADQRLGLLAGGDAVGGAELLGLLALVGQRVHRDDVGRPGMGGTLDGVDADPPDAEDHDRVAGGDLGRVDRRAPTGRDPAAGQHGLIQRQVVVHLHARVLGDGGVLGEGPDHAHRAEVLALGVEAEAPIGHAALQDGRAQVAQVLLPGRAPAAVAAGGDEGADHVVAGLDLADARTDLLDDAGAFVAANDREPGHDVAVPKVLVGVAEPGRHVADQHLAVPGPVEVELDHLPVPAQLPEHRALGLHRPASFTRRVPDMVWRWPWGGPRLDATRRRTMPPRPSWCRRRLGGRVRPRRSGAS